MSFNFTDPRRKLTRTLFRNFHLDFYLYMYIFFFFFCFTRVDIPESLLSDSIFKNTFGKIYIAFKRVPMVNFGASERSLCNVFMNFPWHSYVCFFLS